MTQVRSEKARFFPEAEMIINIYLLLKNFKRSSCSIPQNHYKDRQEPDRGQAENTQTQNIMGRTFHSFEFVQQFSLMQMVINQTKPRD